MQLVQKKGKKNLRSFLRLRNQTNSRVAIATVAENFQTGRAGTWYSVNVLGMSLKLSKFTQKLLPLLRL